LLDVESFRLWGNCDGNTAEMRFTLSNLDFVSDLAVVLDDGSANPTVLDADSRSV
jgi:hypothetical protein